MKAKEIEGWEAKEKQFPNDPDHYKAIAHIRHNESGAVLDYETSVLFNEDGPSAFWWSPDGNAGCDCNRGLFFDDSDYECGHSAFSVNLSNPVDGKVFYREYD